MAIMTVVWAPISRLLESVASGRVGRDWLTWGAWVKMKPGVSKTPRRTGCSGWRQILLLLALFSRLLKLISWGIPSRYCNNEANRGS
jgi:hypothetical protein